MYAKPEPVVPLGYGILCGGSMRFKNKNDVADPDTVVGVKAHGFAAG